MSQCPSSPSWLTDFGFTLCLSSQARHCASVIVAETRSDLSEVGRTRLGSEMVGKVEAIEGAREAVLVHVRDFFERRLFRLSSGLRIFT